MWNFLVHQNQYQLVKAGQDTLSGQTIVSNSLITMIEVENTDGLVNFSELKIPSLEIEKSLLDIIGKLFSFMPSSVVNAEQYIPTEFWPKDSKLSDSITFFGGSFNPWHEGHGECLRQCSELEDLIVVIPDYSPWKDNINKGPLKTLLELSMCVQNKFPIYPGFWAKEDRNPTISWLGQVKLSTINWLMGDDTFFHFLKWTSVEEVASKLSKIYVVPRDHNSDELKAVEKDILDLSPELEVTFLKNHLYQDLSSTKLR